MIFLKALYLVRQPDSVVKLVRQSAINVMCEADLKFFDRHGIFLHVAGELGAHFIVACTEIFKAV